MRLRSPFEVAGELLDLGYSKARNDTDQPEPVKPEPQRCRVPLADVWRHAVAQDPGIRCSKPFGHLDSHEWQSDMDWIRWDAKPRRMPEGSKAL